MPLRRNLGRLFRLLGSPKPASQGRDVGISDRNSRLDYLLSLGLAYMTGQFVADTLWLFPLTSDEDETHISRKCLLQSQAFHECMKKNDYDPTMCKSYLDAFDDCMSKPGGGF